MPDRHPRKIAAITDFAMTGDGKKFAFNVVTQDHQKTNLEIDATELGTLIQYLITHAATMAMRAHNDSVELSPQGQTYSPIPTQGIGISSGSSHSDSLLVVRLFGFELAFEIPNSELASLAESIGRTATLMSGDHSKSN